VGVDLIKVTGRFILERVKRGDRLELACSHGNTIWFIYLIFYLFFSLQFKYLAIYINSSPSKSAEFS
jgi:hypothetical protein